MHLLFVLLLLGTYSEVESICTILYGKTTKTLLLYIGGLHVECHIYNYMMKTRLISTTIIIAFIDNINYNAVFPQVSFISSS